MNPDREKELILKLKEDPKAFGILYEEYYPKIFGYILRRVGHLETAQDLTSETFLKAVRNLWQYRIMNLPFSSWFYKIATNEINYYFRKKKQIIYPLESIFADGDPEDELSNNPETELIEAEEKLQIYQDFINVQKAILKLDLKYQEVLTLKYFEKKKINEISQILNKKEGTIKSLLSRGIEKLRELISRDDDATFCKNKHYRR